MKTTWEERLNAGRARREVVPRSAHAEWSARPDRSDPVGVLEARGTSRVQELLPIRYGRMCESSFAFYRGAAAIMAKHLIASWAARYAVVNENDHAALLDAISSGRLEASTDL